MINIPLPLAICDGDSGGPMEMRFEKFFDGKGIGYDKCYNLYRKWSDLSKYKTIAFFTTNTFVTDVQRILNFDKSNLECLIIIGDYAYEICADEAKRLNIDVFVLDLLSNELVEASEYFKK